MVEEENFQAWELNENRELFFEILYINERVDLKIFCKSQVKKIYKKSFLT